MAKKSFSEEEQECDSLPEEEKEELKEKLETLSEGDESEFIRDIAMCYCPLPMREVHCESCGKMFEESEYDFENFSSIKHLVDKIKDLGYDVKVERVCRSCAAQKGIMTDCYGNPLEKNRLYDVFYFKTNGQDQYHIVESSNSNDYDILYRFLRTKTPSSDPFLKKRG